MIFKKIVRNSSYHVSLYDTFRLNKKNNSIHRDLN